MSVDAMPAPPSPSGGNPPAQRTMDPGCFAITSDKKYFSLVGQDGRGRFIKRSLTEAEWLIRESGTPIPATYDVAAHVRNEAAAIAFVRAHTDVPVPNVVCSFDDGGRTYLIENEVPGVNMADLPDDAKAVVMQEVEAHLRALHSVKGTSMGGFCGVACLPYRLARILPKGEKVTFQPDVAHELVLCHNDLSQHNIIVDPQTLKINAIVDWEFAGFYPVQFEFPFYRRKFGEKTDVPELLEIVEACASEDSQGITSKVNLSQATKVQ
ncbi:kinase-like domain-containing protein [Schizophyllum fasciatum]